MKRLAVIGSSLALVLCAVTGCTSFATVAHELKDDPANIDIMTPYGSFHRSFPTTNWVQMPYVPMPVAPASPARVIHGRESIQFDPTTNSVTGVLTP
jgi:hypothetical protein